MVVTQKYFLISLIGLLVGFFSILAILNPSFFSQLQKYEKTAQIAVQNEPPTATPSPSPTPDPLAPKNYLLLGYVGGKHDGGLLTDTIIIAQIQPKTNMVILISIPRDTWVDIPQESGSMQGKINQVYALGSDAKRRESLPKEYQQLSNGLQLTQDVIGEISGLSFSGSIAISQAGLLSALDRIGPITVQVPYSFTDSFYPIPGEENNPCEKSEEEIASLSAQLRGFDLEKQFLCRYEELQFSAGEQILTASEAAKFVRSRHGNSGGNDFGRSQRQQALLESIKNELAKPSVWLKLPTLISDLFKSVTTNLSIAEGLEVAELLNPLDQLRLQSYQLSISNVLKETRSIDGQYILVEKVSTESAQTTEAKWKTIRDRITEWTTQAPAHELESGGEYSIQAP